MVEQLSLNNKIKSIEEVAKGSGGSQLMDWGYTYTKVDSVYRGIYTGNGVKVAILDTGMAYHEDLPNATVFRDLINDQTTQYDDHGHGTFIAGIIAGKNNDLGYVGVAPNVQLYICKVLDDENRGCIDDFVKGIEWAIDQGVDIINFSIYTDDWDEVTVRDACRAAYNAGIIVVSCSGNGYLNNMIAQNQVCNPAKDYSCVGVGSIDSNGTRSSFSNYGTGLDLVAPGENVNSTYINFQYAMWSGTSFATAYVTGHLAILKQKYPSYSRYQLVDKLLSLTDGIGNEEEYGAGCIMAETVSLAKLWLSTPTQYGFKWNVSGLQELTYPSTSYCSIYKTSDRSSGFIASSGVLAYNETETNNLNPVDDSGLFNASSDYTIYAFRNVDGVWYPAGSESIVTALATPYLDTAPITTTNSITISIVSVNHANHYYATCNNQIQDNTSGDFSWSGLIPNKQYQITYYVTDTNGYYPTSAPVYENISTLENIKPTNFVWTYAGYNSSGTLVLGTAKMKDYGFYIHHDEWNGIISKIQAWYQYKNIPTYCPIMRIVDTNYTFYAENDFNIIKNAIGYFYNNSNPALGIDIVDKSSGNDIIADELNKIVDKLNNIP